MTITPPPPDPNAETEPPTRPETPDAIESGTPPELVPFVRAVHRVEDAIEAANRTTADALAALRATVLDLHRGMNQRVGDIEEHIWGKRRG